ncbi:MAG: endo-1,4-beta-xylanase [Bacteroidota bacterium]
MKKVLLLFSFFFSISVCSQDAYHTNLQNMLQNEYNVPVGEWILFNTEDAILNNAISYGSAASIQSISDQPFTQKVTHVLNAAGANPWNAGWNLSNQSAIQIGDVLLATFYIRSVGGVGKVNFFAENGTTFEKEVVFTLPVSEEWTRYFIPFESGSNYNTNALVWGFHLAFQAQTIEIGGFTGLNYNNTTTIDNLPEAINNQFYEGWQSDAPWRATAADRINQFRKADLTVEVKNSNGEPIENAAVKIEMLEHEFAFGTAVTASRLNGNNAHNVIYENKITNLDGAGHGFNWVVFENDLKWPAWEDEWLVSNSELVNAVSWLRNNDIQIRGHTLVWPGSSNLPTDINANLSNIPYIKDRINGHLEEILQYPGLQGEIAEWDVLNEIVSNTTLANAFKNDPSYVTGRELYVEIFQKVRDLDPDVGLWLNDFSTLTLNNSPGNLAYDQLKQFTQELVDADVGLEGIGFQAHIGGFPNSIPAVLATYDDFYDAFGLQAKVTEFDLPTFVDQELAANYLTDFMTATFSHESMNGFLFWNFWDGATWQAEGSNLFDLDWSTTEPYDAYVDLVFNQWWTDDVFASDANGIVNERVFKGWHRITYTCDGEVITETTYVSDPVNLNITCDNISTNTNDLLDQSEISVFPNPTSSILNIKRNNNATAWIKLVDATGKLVQATPTNAREILLNVEQYRGLYFLIIESETERFFEKIMIE